MFLFSPFYISMCYVLFFPHLLFMWVLGFDTRRGLGISLFASASKTALGSTQPPIQWVQEAPSLGVKRPGSEPDHSPPFNAEIKEWVGLYLHSPNTSSWHGAYLSTGTTLTLPLSLHLIKLASNTGVGFELCQPRSEIHFLHYGKHLFNWSKMGQISAV
jgi:hypothetical protein